MVLLERETPPSVQAFFNVGILSLSLYGQSLRFVEWTLLSVGLEPTAAKGILLLGFLIFFFFFANILCNSLLQGSIRMNVCTSAGWYEYRSVYNHATSGVRTYGPSIRCLKDGTRYRAVRCDQHNNIIISNVYSTNTEKE